MGRASCSSCLPSLLSSWPPLLLQTDWTLLLCAADRNGSDYAYRCHRLRFAHLHSKPNQVPASMIVNADQIAAHNLPAVQDLQTQPSTSVKFLSESAEPPTYQDVAGVGSKYQKF